MRVKTLIFAGQNNFFFKGSVFFQIIKLTKLLVGIRTPFYFKLKSDKKKILSLTKSVIFI